MVLVLAIWIVVTLVLVIKGITRVKPGYYALVERLGTSHAVLPPGIHWIVPFMDKAKTITATEWETICKNK